MYKVLTPELERALRLVQRPVTISTLCKSASETFHHDHQAKPNGVPNIYTPIKDKKTEHSVNDVAMARSLRYLAYIFTALATFWTYDYVRSLHEEWTFLLRSRWNKVKFLYIITRYVPFIVIITELYLTFTPNENPNQCRMLNNIYSCFGVISVTCSDGFFVLRTYALWNNNKIILVAMLSAFLAIVLSFSGIWFTAIATSHVRTSVIPGITGCYRSSRSVQLSMPFLLLFIFALGLVSLTLIRVIHSWRTAKSPLHAVLVKHNIFYYVCSLLISAVNVLMPILTSNSIYHAFFEHFQVFSLAILATRMHLYLWDIDQHAHSSDAVVCISMSDMSPVSPADCTV
ncbi:hypothetical protein EDB19DRAFT_1962723 [Suillus lakei]|nr:hypothetical protein EDB19DRAFT_1962723 [Suillus lakei]